MCANFANIEKKSKPKVRGGIKFAKTASFLLVGQNGDISFYDKAKILLAQENCREELSFPQVTSTGLTNLRQI